MKSNAQRYLKTNSFVQRIKLLVLVIMYQGNHYVIHFTIIRIKKWLFLVKCVSQRKGISRLKYTVTGTIIPL